MATQIGTIIDGKYEVLKQIGKGGMSVVYLAMDKRLNKQWAVKEILKTADGENDEVIINSLLAEANLMKRLDHPALPRIVDIIDNGKTLYIIMDYIEGESLDKILKEYGAQPEDVVISWAMQLCDALNYLHSQKPPIIYRDMKPANIMLKPEGNLKVIDFGIAREYKEQNLADTTILGTKGYASPEHYGARQTDRRSDIYTLGRTMHHLITGVDPRTPDYMYVPVRQWNPELSEGIEYIIDKCNAIDPEHRYQNCDELMYDLQHVDQIGPDFKKKKKKKLKLFLASAITTIVFTAAGVTGQILKMMENENRYEEYMKDAESNMSVEDYFNAIDIYGDRIEPYRGLLNIYQNSDEFGFGDQESKEYLDKFNRNKESFDKNSEEYYDLLFETGKTYFYKFTGNDGSLRAKILMSKPYFDEIKENGENIYSNISVVESYLAVCDFYSQYVASGTSVKEPQKENYEELLESLEICFSNIEEFESDDSAYTKLFMYTEIMNLLKEHKRGLATTEVSQEKVLSILDEMYDDGMNLAVTRQESMDLQEYLGEHYAEYRQDIVTAYENVERRK